MSSLSLSIKLGHKIGSISVIAILGIAAIAAIYVYGASVQQTYQRKADAANSIYALTSGLHVKLLESRRAEKDFLLRNDLKYADNHNALQKTIVGDIEALQQQARTAGLDDLVQKSGVILAGFNNYAAQFRALVETKKRLGLNENSGLEGALRGSVHAIETKLNELKEPKFLVTMLMMRRHEKDFMLRRDPKYGGDMKKRATELIAALEHSELSPETKDEVKRNLAAYQRDFFAWMESALTVVNEQKAMSEGYAAIEPVVDAILGAAKETNAITADENQKFRDDIKLKLFIAMLLIAVAVSALGYWIGRSISVPLRALTNVMKELANGNKAIEIPHTERGDEIGENARTAKTFKENLVRIEKMEAEQKANEARLGAEREAAMRKQAADREAAMQNQKENEARAAAEREAAMAKVTHEFEAAVGGIVKAAVAGDFTQRVDLRGKSGLVLNIGTAINSLCENTAKALDDLINMLNALAEGNLTRRITAEYQGNFATLKNSANTTAIRIGATISDIKSSAREVTNASAEISTSTTDLSQRTEEQAASLEETSAAMEQISATVKKNAENAQAANQFATSTRAVADRGGQVASEAVEAMARIEESSRKIADIIGIIDEIARQTNLLALNAAVEAARAGEAGLGFAVVASEVRSLAQRSSQAAKDIKDLITNSSGQVKEGVELVNKAGASLNEIVESIKKVAEVVSDIANASAEQSTGIEQVNKALTQMDEVTQQNSALVEENAATAKTLEHQAKAMDERVAFFRLDEAAMSSVDAIRTVATAEIPARKRAAAGPAPKRAPAPTRQGNGATKGEPVGRMHAALATATKQEPGWKEF